MNKAQKLISIIEMMKGINDDLNIVQMPRELYNTVLSPTEKGKERNQYDNKRIRDFDLDDFANYVSDHTNINNLTFSKKDPLLNFIFVNGFVPNMSKDGSQVNMNKNFIKYKTQKSALYDIWTILLQLTGFMQNLPTNESRQSYLSVRVKKNDLDKFNKIIDNSDYTYDDFNKEFNSYQFPVDDESDAENLEHELDTLFLKYKISVTYEFED